MLVSTKGRYALRMMIYLAKNSSYGPVSLKHVAEQEEVSLKYLEQVVRPLSDAGLIQGTRGKSGGYELARSADSITAGDILRAAEGSTAPVSCLGSGAEVCPRVNECTTIAFWRGLDEVIDRYVEGITLADLCSEAPSLE